MPAGERRRGLAGLVGLKGGDGNGALDSWARCVWEAGICARAGEPGEVVMATPVRGEQPGSTRHARLACMRAWREIDAAVEIE